MINKTKNFVLLLSLCILFFACKKDESRANNYYVKFSKNGTPVSWTGFAKGTISQDDFTPSLINLGIAGQSDDGSERLDITLQKTGTSFSTGTYDSDVNTPVTTTVRYITQFTTSPKVYTFSWSGTVYSRYFITITSITETSISGTFSGNFLATSGGEELTITDGEFNVERIL